MPRTKEQIAELLTDRKFNIMLRTATWADLVSAVSGYPQDQKDKLVTMLVQNRTDEAGRALRRALDDEMRIQARARVDAILLDDSLTLIEIDELL